MTGDLFEGEPQDVPIAPGAVLLGGFARPLVEPVLAALREVVARAPFRHLITPGGHW
jgi:DNA oxidative demethylase